METQAGRAVWTITLLCAQGESEVKCLKYGNRSENAPCLCCFSCWLAAGTSPPRDLITDKEPPHENCRQHCLDRAEIVKKKITSWAVEGGSGQCVNHRDLRDNWTVHVKTQQVILGWLHPWVVSMYPVVRALSIARKKNNKRVHGGQRVLLLPCLSAMDQWTLGVSHRDLPPKSHQHSSWFPGWDWLIGQGVI